MEYSRKSIKKNIVFIIYNDVANNVFNRNNFTLIVALLLVGLCVFVHNGGKKLWPNVQTCTQRIQIRLFVGNSEMCV